MRTSLSKIVILFVAANVSLFLLSWASDRFAPESAPVARGAAYAGSKGCIVCHGDSDSVLADGNDRNCSNVNNIIWHPEYNVECTDVMAFFQAVRLRRNFEERAQASSTNSLIAGERLARTYHCFQCHGFMGQGGFDNAGSFKGYIPGYFGSDFRILTRNADRESVREWIMHGIDRRIVQRPLTGRVASYYFKKQAVSMPRFESLRPEEIDVLVDYVIALNQFGAMTADTLLLYGELSTSVDDLISRDRDDTTIPARLAAGRRVDQTCLHDDHSRRDESSQCAN